jgi:hypothetical protein
VRDPEELEKLSKAFFLDITYRKHLETNRALIRERSAGKRREVQWPSEMESFMCERLYPEWKKAVTRSFDRAS